MNWMIEIDKNDDSDLITIMMMMKKNLVYDSMVVDHYCQWQTRTPSIDGANDCSIWLNSFSIQFAAINMKRGKKQLVDGLTHLITLFVFWILFSGSNCAQRLNEFQMDR